MRRAETLAEQLQAALNSRVVIEQANGRIAERTGLDVGQAFTLLRQHARTTNQRLTDVARHVIGSPTADLPAPAARIKPRQAGTAGSQPPVPGHDSCHRIGWLSISARRISILRIPVLPNRPRPRVPSQTQSESARGWFRRARR